MSNDFNFSFGTSILLKTPNGNKGLRFNSSCFKQYLSFGFTYTDKEGENRWNDDFKKQVNFDYTGLFRLKRFISALLQNKLKTGSKHTIYSALPSRKIILSPSDKNEVMVALFYDRDNPDAKEVLVLNKSDFITLNYYLQHILDNYILLSYSVALNYKLYGSKEEKKDKNNIFDENIKDINEFKESSHKLPEDDDFSTEDDIGEEEDIFDVGNEIDLI